MGREAICTIHFRGGAAEGKALLEGEALILRGDIRGRFPRSAITGIEVQGDTLALVADGQPLALDLGAKEAARWHAALLKPAPTLAEKLGIGPVSRVFVVGSLSDPDLAATVDPARAPSLAQAQMLLAVVLAACDLEDALATARMAPTLPLWCVYRKGEAPVSDGMIRSRLRNEGMIDTKSCAVSELLTATRYGFRKFRSGLRLAAAPSGGHMDSNRLS